MLQEKVSIGAGKNASVWMESTAPAEEKQEREDIVPSIPIHQSRD